MKTKTPVVPDMRKYFAAQSAQLGLINASDLSLLTGVPTPRLNILAKKGQLRSYSEYLGKRFFNFSEILAWLIEPGPNDEAKLEIGTAMQEELKKTDCPYSYKKVISKPAGTTGIDIIWKAPASQ